MLVVCQFGGGGLDCWYIWQEDVGRRVLLKEVERLCFERKGIKLSLGRYRAALPLGVYYQSLWGEVLPKFRSLWVELDVAIVFAELG